MFFGTGSCKYEIVNGATEVLLEYSNLAPDYSIRDIGTTVSIYDHFTTYEFNGDYSDFTVDLYLYKYDDPKVKFDEIYPNSLYAEVYFWPHVDGNAISASISTPAVFFIDRMEHSYTDSTNTEEDILTLHFTSTDYTTLYIL